MKATRRHIFRCFAGTLGSHFAHRVKAAAPLDESPETAKLQGYLRRDPAFACLPHGRMLDTGTTRYKKYRSESGLRYTIETAPWRHKGGTIR